MGDYYNGYAWPQRQAILREIARVRKHGELAKLAYLDSGSPCAMCGDPGEHAPPGQWHSEDYSIPFLLAPPATFILCNTCHGRLHKRFPKGDGTARDWPLYILFLNSGGYGREFVRSFSSKERSAMLATLAADGSVSLKQVRDRQLSGAEWWQNLTCDPESLVAAWARPRPLRVRPSREAYQLALSDIGLTTHEAALLQLHARSPLRRLTMRDAAQAVFGKPVPSIANLAYGRLARRLAQATGWQPDVRADGSPIWMTAVAEGWQPEDREFEWVLVPALVGLFGKST